MNLLELEHLLQVESKSSGIVESGLDAVIPHGHAFLFLCLDLFAVGQWKFVVTTVDWAEVYIDRSCKEGVLPTKWTLRQAAFLDPCKKKWLYTFIIWTKNSSVQSCTIKTLRFVFLAILPKATTMEKVTTGYGHDLLFVFQWDETINVSHLGNSPRRNVLIQEFGNEISLKSFFSSGPGVGFGHQRSRR